MTSFQVVRYFNTALFGILLLSQSSLLYAEDKGCWARFFDKGSYQGKSFQVNGEKKFRTLRNVNGDDWSLRIESIIVGPKAQVTVFENLNFKLTLTEMANHPGLMKSLGITEQDIREDSELIFHPKSRVHTLGDFNFYRKIKSLKVDCVD